MTSLETALAAAGVKIIGEELIEWLKNRESDLSEDDWAEMGLFVGRKLVVDYKNVESSWLHKSRKKDVVRRIESASGIYRELEILGEERGFNVKIIEIYSELADICSNWSIETDGLGPENYKKRGEEFFELYEDYQDKVN